MDVKNKKNRSWYLFLKRVFDIFFGGIFCILSIPVILFSALCIGIVDGNPIFYTQNREGKDGKYFKMWKLRTMKRGSREELEVYLEKNPEKREEWETYLKLKDDPRIIPIFGRIFRKFSIDELPQFLNVVVGDMSLVGPRPLPSYHIEKFDSEFRRVRQSVKPGVTGLWQIRARSSADIETQERLDMEYITHASILFDLMILISTPWRVLIKNEGAF